MGAFDDLIPASTGQPQSGVAALPSSNPFADLVPARSYAPKEPQVADEFGIGEEVRGIGRALNRGARRFVQQADVIGLRRPGELGDDVQRAQEELVQFDAQFPNATPENNPAGFDWRQRQLGRVAQLEGERNRFQQMSPALAQSFASQQERIEALPETRAQQDFQVAKGFRQAIASLARNPIELAATTIAESAPTMAITMAGAATGPAMPVVAGAASQSAESAGRVTRAMSEAGIDLRNPQQVLAWFQDRAKSAPEIAKADLAALGPASFDALTAGLAGRWLSAARGRGVRPVLGATATEVGVQAAGGGTGAIAGNLIAGEGIDWKDVILEVIGELVPTEAIANVAAERRTQATPATPNERPQNVVPPETITQSQKQAAGEIPAQSRVAIVRPPEEETSILTAQPSGDNQVVAMQMEAESARDRVANQIAERVPISGQDARMAGARDRMSDLGYVFVEDQDNYVPIRQTGRTGRARESLSRRRVEPEPQVAEQPSAAPPALNVPQPATVQRVPDEELRVSVQSPITRGNRTLQGFVQLDSMVGGENQWSSNPNKLRELGYDIPTQEELQRLPQGQYTMAEAKRRLAETANEESKESTIGNREAAPTSVVAKEAPQESPSKANISEKEAPQGRGILETESVAQSLPPALRRSSPRYGFGSNNYELQFASDLDKALYVVAADKPSKAHNQFIDWLAAQGIDETQAKQRGRQVRAAIKTRVQQAVAQKVKGPLTIPNLGTTQATEATSTTTAQPVTPTVVPAPETAAVAEPTPAAANLVQQKYRIGTSPQTWTMVERLAPNATEQANDEQPVRIRNDRTGAEEVALEADLTPVQSRTGEKSTRTKRKPRQQLDKELKDAGLDPSSFQNAEQKKDALQRVAAKIEQLQKRIRGSRSTLNMGVPAAILDTALEAARLTLLATSSITQAINRAIEVIRERMGESFDAAMESDIRNRISSELIKDESPDNQQFFGNLIGEEKETIERVKEVKAALEQNGYAPGDVVTPDNTTQAWRLFSMFVDPATREAEAAKLKTAVPQEMAPGILQSLLYEYALKLAATGDTALFRAMADNSNQFIMGTGPQFRSTIARSLRALGVGAQFSTFQNETEVSNVKTDAIAGDLGIKGDDKRTKVNRIKDAVNEAKPDVGAIETAVGNTKVKGGTKTVKEAMDEANVQPPTDAEIDEQVEAEQESIADQQAAEALRRLELDYAGVEWLKPGHPSRSIIQKILREHYKGREVNGTLVQQPIVPIQGNTNRVIAALSQRFQNEAEVSPEIADQLAFAAETKRQNDWANSRARIIRRASQSNRISGLIEAIMQTPYLAQRNPEWLRQTAEDWFLASGLSREQAQAAAEMFQSEFQERLIQAQSRAAQRVLDRAAPETVQRLLDAIRTGVLDPDKSWVDSYAEKIGIKIPTREESKRLAELDLKLQDPNLTAPERAETTEQLMGIYLHLKVPPSVMQRIAANFVVTNLTGVRTMTVNVFAPMMRLLTERALATAANPGDLVRNVRTLWEAYRDFPRRIKYSLTKDAYTFINNEYEQATNEMRRVWENGRKDVDSQNLRRKGIGYLKLIYGSQQYMMRLLNAVDQAQAVTEREVQMANYATTAFKTAGLGTRETDQLVQAVSRLKRRAYEDGIEGGMSPDQAQVHSDEVANEQLQDFVSEKIGNTPEAATMARESAAAAERDAYSAIGRLAPGIREEMEGGLVSRAIYHNILRAAARLRGGKGADPILGVSLLGYVAIPFRTARYIAWNSPYGLLRLGINRYRNQRGLESWWKQSLGNEYQERHRLKMALAGSAVLSVLTGLGIAALKNSSDDDAGDDEFGVYFTGAGPKNKNLRDAWEKSGFRPNSIVAFVGGKPITVPLTRIGEPLAHYAWILSARDDYQWRKREAEASGGKFDETWTEQTGHALGTYVGLLGQRGIIQNIAQWARIGSGEGGTEKAVADVASRLAASSALPWLGLQRSILDMAQGRVDRSSIQSATAANFGIPGVFWQNRQVNRFGDPVSNQTWFGKIANTGVPLAFQVADTDENQKLYRTLAQKGAAPPELRRYVLEDRYGPLTDEQYAQFARRSGQLIKQSVVQNLPQIEQMSSQQAKTYLSRIATQADRAAGAELGLQRVPQASTATQPQTAATVAMAAPVAPARRSSTGRARSLLRSPRSRSSRSRLSTMRVPRLRSSRSRGIRRPTGLARRSLTRPRRRRSSVRF